MWVGVRDCGYFMVATQCLALARRLIELFLEFELTFGKLGHLILNTKTRLKCNDLVRVRSTR